MNDAGVMKLGAFAAVALLAGCGGSEAVVKRPPPKVEAAPPAPREPSAFEQRWSSACSEHGAVGQCPAPFDRPAVFVDVGESEQAAPPFCGSLESKDGAAAHDAIAAKRKALGACFQDVEAGTFVELGPSGALIADPARADATRTETCVAKLVTAALANHVGTPPERVVVLLGSTTNPSDEVLSKASLDAVTSEHASEVSACYDAALEVWPGLAGRIASAVVIWFDGRAALVRTDTSTLDNPMLECCINTAIQSWPFPKPSNGSIALVTFPFTLGSQP